MANAETYGVSFTVQQAVEAVEAVEAAVALYRSEGKKVEAIFLFLRFLNVFFLPPKKTPNGILRMMR